MSDTPQSLHGRQRLINAALNLSFHKRSFSSLGIREITREAGLSAPAFYRHFSELSDLGTAVIFEVEKAVIDAFTEVRKSTVHEEDLDIRPILIQRFFKWAAENPKAIVVGACEAFGALPEMREGFRSTIYRVAREISTDSRISSLLPALPQNELDEMLFTTAQNVYFLAVEYVECPDQREAIYARTLRIVDILFTGAHALYALHSAQTTPP